MKLLFLKMRFKIKSYTSYLKYRLHWTYSSVKKIIPKIKSIDDTIQEAIDKRASVSRYGDGEIRIINGESIEFQNYSDELSKSLSKILKSNLPNHFVCLPDVFISVSNYKREAKYIWTNHLASYLPIWLKHIDHNKLYFNSFITRPFIIFKDYNQSKHWFEAIKKIWQNREIVLLEGSKSRLGVGNDLFNNTTSIERILCPSTNAFSKYGEILNSSAKIEKSKLILIALGPTATVLAHDLHKLGYQAIDIGHIDIEYEWFLMKAKWTVNIADKHTNEALDNVAPDDIFDINYNKQIILNIS
jgi:glycosyltransferase family protein